ncbi:MAG: helix-turn-helix transcriptional regulator [Clostridia bacterium]|nr:helix-turn-helix transcriptional regulator [Clostridia bacterium]
MYSVFEKLLLEKGLSVYRVAQNTGISTVTFTNWKKGKYTPKVDKLQKIADCLGVSLDYLMTGEDANEKKYYFSAATAEAAQEIFDNPELHALFDAAKDSTPDDLKLAAELLKRLKATNPDG